MIRTNLIIALALLVLFTSTITGAQERVRPVSLIAVLADPDRFDGKVITVEGFLVAGHENQHKLYLDETTLYSGLVSRSVGIPFGLKNESELLARNCSYVLLTGKFNSREYFLGAGTFETIDRILPIKASTTCLEHGRKHLH